MPRAEGLTSWSRLRELLSVTLWTSFLAACLETGVFFAFFDPMVLSGDATTPMWLMLRPTAYAAGFFFFWTFTFVSCTLTAFMLNSGPGAPPKITDPPS
jgi:hypothetical protein